MYGPIANLTGYNPNATYLPPGLAASSSYPERVKPTQQFYDMAPLPSVVDQSVMDLAGSGLSSADPYDSAFGPTGISGGIGGPDGKEYKFLNDFIGYLKQPQTVPPVFSGPQQMVPPNFTGPSNDQYSGEYLVPPVFAGPQQQRRAGTASFIEGDEIPNFSGPSNDQYSGAYLVPQVFSGPQQPGKLNNSHASEVGGPTYYAQPQLYGGAPDYGDYGQSSFPLRPFDIQPSGLTQSQLDQLGQLPSLPAQDGGRQYYPNDGLGVNVNRALNAASLFGGPLGTAANLGVGLGVGLFDGERMTSRDTGDGLGGYVQDYTDNPGFLSRAGNWVGRTIHDVFHPHDENQTAAEKSAADAYGRSDVYNKDGSGWQMGAPAYSDPPVDTTWSGNNPAAWGFNAEPWAGDFGAGRYDAGFMPSEWQINQGIIDNWAPQTYQLPMSPIMPIDPGASWFAPPELGNWADDELPMFGPGGRYGTGRWSTD